jgi:tetratricopeptide (TPR) repeat protein
MKNVLIRIPVGGLLRAALCAAVGMVGLASAPAMAGGYWSDGIHIPEGVCVDCESPPNSGGDLPSGPSPQAREKAERIRKANSFNEAGLAAWNRGEWGIAAEQFRQAYAWNPASKVIFKNLINARHKVGLAAMEEGDWEYAADTFQSLLHHQPDSPEFQRLAAAAEEKRRALREAYKLDRQVSAAWERGDYREALRLLRMLQILHDGPGVRDDIAKLEKYEKYLADLAKIELGDNYDQQADRANANGDFELALKLYKQALATYPDPSPKYRQFIADYENVVQKLQNRAVVTEVQSSVSKIAVDLKNSKPAGDLELSDFAVTGDAFGTRKSNPTLSPAGRPKIEGSVTDPGAQLKSVDQHSLHAKSQGNDTDKEMAREGFETPGEYRGALVHPDKNNHRPPLSALDRQIPGGAKDDGQIREMQAWYRSLEVRKAEKEQKIAEIKEQQKTSKDPLLATKITTLANEVKQLNDDQGQATKVVKERVAVIKKRVLDMGLAWDETPPSDTPPSDSPSAMK